MTAIDFPTNELADITLDDQRCELQPEFDPFVAPTPTTRVVEVRPRARVAVAGTVVDSSVAQWAGGAVLEVTVDDGTGPIVLAFFGRRAIAGVEPGCTITAAGTVVAKHGVLMFMNPYLWLSVRASTAAY
jgi:hypothetical protein